MPLRGQFGQFGQSVGADWSVSAPVRDSRGSLLCPGLLCTSARCPVLLSAVGPAGSRRRRLLHFIRPRSIHDTTLRQRSQDPSSTLIAETDLSSGNIAVKQRRYPFSCCIFYIKHAPSYLVKNYWKFLFHHTVVAFTKYKIKRKR